jgi:hypothetical protein
MKDLFVWISIWVIRWQELDLQPVLARGKVGIVTADFVRGCLEAVSKPDYFVRFALFPTGGVDLISK